MVRFLAVLSSLVGLLAISCGSPNEVSSVDPVNWEKRTVTQNIPDSLSSGTTYLSIYSQIYSQTEHKTKDLTVTVSLRNTHLIDTLYIDKAEYFNTQGHSVRSYFNKTIYVAPMETVEIVIAEVDQSGGTGGNFLFDWRIKPTSSEPLFEAIMISTSGQQGISFATFGRRIK